MLDSEIQIRTSHEGDVCLTCFNLNTKQFESVLIAKSEKDIDWLIMALERARHQRIRFNKIANEEILKK